MQQQKPIELDLDFYNKMLKVAIFRANPKARTMYDKKKVALDSETQGLFENGVALGKYLVVLKDLMVIFFLLMDCVEEE